MERAAACSSERGRQAVDESQRQRLVGAQVATRQHQVHRGGDADQAHGAHRAAEAGVDAEHHLRETKHRLRIIDAKAVVAGERQLESAAQAVAVDRGHGRARASRSSRSRIACAARTKGSASSGERTCANSRTSAPAMNPAFAGLDDEAARRSPLDLGEPRIELRHDLARQRVRGRIGPVERQPARFAPRRSRATSAESRLRCPSSTRLLPLRRRRAARR